MQLTNKSVHTLGVWTWKHGSQSEHLGSSSSPAGVVAARDMNPGSSHLPPGSGCFPGKMNPND